MIRATPAGSYAKQPGNPGVRVGVIDTGVDGTHPDIAPNFDAALSRNFVTDIPSIDGPCEHASLRRPGERGRRRPRHARRGHDRRRDQRARHRRGRPERHARQHPGRPGLGFFFLQATVDALTYAGDIGIDVVNMSFFIDPWLFNCADNPADSPEQQLEQRTIIEATHRALDYAHNHGVTLVAAEGNEAHRPRQPDRRRHQPRLPAGTENAPNRRQLLPDDADRGPPRHRCQVRRPVDRRRPTTRTTASRTRTSRRPAAGSVTSSARRATESNENLDPVRLPGDRWRSRMAISTRTARRTTPFVVRGLPGRHLRLLPVPAGHVDGVPARGGCRGADRQPVRQPAGGKTVGSAHR